ncbi:MAG: DNA polymerase III subunit alpha, partial [Deltaproteobacteria bacterium]|nr:DNA polymerase III subunit alpha [Deltaproteobacteria bacterium]
MQHSQYVHLHNHSYYSLLDGALPIDAVISKAKDYKMPALAVTDHGNLFGAIEFYQKCMSHGIKPIIGCEAYIVSNGSRKDRDPRRTGEGGYNHLVLLAKNHKGYQNLCRLITLSYLEGFYYKPRIDKEILKEYNEGLIAMSACFKGEIPWLIRKGNIEEAKLACEWFLSVFSAERFFIELMDIGLEDCKPVNENLISMAKALGVGLVATNDCHYLAREDAAVHDALLCIQTGKTLESGSRLQFGSDQFYFKSPGEMERLFEHVPEAISNTLLVASKCNLELDLKSYHFPKFSLPEGTDLAGYLEEKAWAGLAEKITQLSEEKLQIYKDRLKRELEMIKKMGFASYFLIVADFINWAKGQDIPVGPGRGSAAGSLVAYCLNITDVDPIPNKLFFERFLNPERVSMPDMDIDFCMRRRPEVIDYVRQKYGYVSQIITFGKMKARAVIRDVGRVMGVPYGDVDKIAKLIPFAVDMTINKALEIEPQLKKIAKEDERIAKLIAIAKGLEGFPRHASTHAAGVVMSDQPLDMFLPLYVGQHDEIITQFDMKAVEKIGLIKFDFLGLKTLTVMDDAIKMIKKRHAAEINLSKLQLNDKLVYKRLSEGETPGIFQLESSGMTDLVMKLKPTCFEDIVALVALFRPGPLGSGMVEDFINRKHGRTKIEYELPQLAPILKETYGVIVYQEQVMQIASALAGFTLGDADLLRRAMGKKKAEDMALQRTRFLEGCAKNRLPAKKAEKIFDLMAEFAGYGFNKSHSAAYALIAYQTAFLRYKYPTEFMASLLTSEMGNTDKLLFYMNACREDGIKVLPPDVNESLVTFTVTGEKEIRFGMAAVKNVGEAAVEAIISVRNGGGNFTSLDDFCARVDSRKVNKRVVESLIKCGAFDSLGVHRAELLATSDVAMARAVGIQRDREIGQTGLFDSVPEAGKDTGAGRIDGMIPWSEHELLQFEKEALGFYISGHPLAQFESIMKLYATASTDVLAEKGDGNEVRIGGVAASLREITTKKGDRMGFVTLEDLKGMADVIVFPELYQKSIQYIKSDQPLFIIGTLDIDEERAKIIAREIFPISEVPAKLTKTVHFKLAASET